MPATVTNGTEASFPSVAAVALGVGLGAFFDGIVLHQILQWRHFISFWPPADSECL